MEVISNIPLKGLTHGELKQFEIGYDLPTLYVQAKQLTQQDKLIDYELTSTIQLHCNHGEIEGARPGWLWLLHLRVTSESIPKLDSLYSFFMELDEFDPHTKQCTTYAPIETIIDHLFLVDWRSLKIDWKDAQNHPLIPSEDFVAMHDCNSDAQGAILQ